MPNQTPEPQYAPGVFIREKTFQNGNVVLNVSIADLDAFVAWANPRAKQHRLNLIIARRKETSDKGLTHTCKLDTWEPKSGAGQSPASAPPQPSAPSDSQAPMTDSDGCPF